MKTNKEVIKPKLMEVIPALTLSRSADNVYEWVEPILRQNKRMKKIIVDLHAMNEGMFKQGDEGVILARILKEATEVYEEVLG